MSPNSCLLIIVNSIRPYGVELVNVLAASECASCRFRYQSKYAPGISDEKSLVGKNGTIVLRHYETAVFMPLRTFVVKEAFRAGDILYISVTLNKIAALNADAHSDQQLSQFHDCVSQAIANYINPPNGDLLNLVLFETVGAHSLVTQWWESSSKNELLYWGHCITIMASKFGFKDYDFYKLVSIRDDAGKQKLFTNSDRDGVDLITGEKLVIEVLQRTYTGKKGDSSLPHGRFIEMTCADDSIVILESKRPLLGKYDLVHFHLRVINASRRINTQLFLRITTEQAQTLIPPLDIPISIRLSRGAVVLSILSAVAFVILLFAYLAPESASKYFPSQWAVTSNQIEKVAVVGMIVCASSLGSFGKDLMNHFKLGNH